ncbi:MAG: hypothetical protein FWC40_03660 [Proteobacteria bacterium]|nr:hypothetical protein [Pseudomonadota bacterium]
MEREELKKDNGGLDSAHASQREVQEAEYSVAPRTPGGGGRSGSGSGGKSKAKTKQTKATSAYLTSIRDAVTKADIGALDQTMRSATKGDTKAHAKDVGLLKDFLAAYTTSSQVLNEYLDKLYVDIDDRDLLMECFHRRFGVPVRDGKAKWTLRAVARLYQNYIGMPVNQILMVKEIITDGTNVNGGGWANSNGTIQIGYMRTDLEAKRGWCDKGDLMSNMNRLDYTQLHETGHQVDKWTNAAQSAGHYSGSASFLAISDWKFEGNDSKKVAQAIHDYAYKPYAELLSITEQKIAMDGAERLVNGMIVKKSLISNELKKSYAALGKNVKGDATTQGKLDTLNSMVTKSTVGYRSLKELTTVLEKSKFYKHIISSIPTDSQYPWDRGKVDGMNRQIHKGYRQGIWYSFSNDAFKGKLSRYQFCAPGEEFAELFASYHISKGKAVGQKFKKWFEDKGLDKGNNHYKDDPSNKSI